MTNSIFVNRVSLGLIALAVSLPAPLLAQTQETERKSHQEVQDDDHVRSSSSTSPGLTFGTGPYISIQVNVNGAGNNINNDAANEPSIAVDPADPSRIVIGWRQFDNISSNFRQAGVAFSQDGGQSWASSGPIEAGLFRSDPVLGVDENGVFYYMSLDGNFDCDLFRSTDGGMTWPQKTSMFGGDKNWMSVDRFTGSGHVYGIWQRFFGCCNEDTFTRSVNGGSSFQSPVFIPESPTFGNTDVGSDGTVYAAGIQADENVGQNFDQFVVARSVNARISSQTPTFQTALVELGGTMRFGTGPNPGGLLGQVNVDADPGQSGRVYVLASTNPPGGDPLDVFIIRSDDFGATWTDPILINDDSGNNWQWMGTLAVAPDGRVDAVWNDSRNSGGNEEITETFYAFSYDNGETWLGQTAIGPQWNSLVGFPNQSKIGDYYDMYSDNSVGHLTYSATYNGEQDVYYARVFPDCNENGVPDNDDIQSGNSTDVDGDRFPDDCEEFTLEAAPTSPNVGDVIDFDFDNGFPGTPGYLFIASINGVPQLINQGFTLFGTDGKANISAPIPNDPAFSGIDFSMVSIGLFLDGAPRISDPVDISIQ